MQQTLHGSHLIQLTQYPGFFPINMALLREAGGLTVIDTGMLGSARAIVNAAAAIGAPIARVLLTHAHRDHAGGLDALMALVPGAELWLTPRQARLLQGDWAPAAGETGRLRGTFVRAGTARARFYAPGDRIGALQSIAAPGHTPDLVAFLDTRDHSLIAGDAFQSQGGLAVTGTLRWGFPWPALATWHKGVALHTARALAGLDPSRLMVGHGPVIEQPAGPMRAAIHEADRATHHAQGFIA